MDDISLDLTLGMIYDAAVAPDRWPALLDRLARDFNCHFGGMNLSSANREKSRVLGVGVDRAEHQEFARRFNKTNPIALRVRPGLAGELIDANQLMARSEMERLEMYQAFFRPNDMGHTARMNLWSGRAGTQSITISRSWNRPAFNDKERSLARTLIPHLQRAARVARHIQHASLMTIAAQSTLDVLPHPVFLLAEDGRPIYTNRGAERLLRKADGLISVRGTLRGAVSSATRALEALIGAASRNPGKGGTARLARPSGEPPLVLVVIPIRNGNDSFFFADQPTSILCVSDPTERETIDPKVLTQLFGLTRAEASLASALLAGHELPAIATSSGRSIYTLRNLLARVMAKTETSRQSELVGLLGQLPRISPDA
jgi:DNA-binding CsgD family transcriptional regulator/PAS domain-containing protein